MNSLDEDGIDVVGLIENFLVQTKHTIDYKKKVVEVKYKPVFKAEDLWEFVQSRDRQDFRVIVDKDNEAIVKNLCCYFTGDKRGAYDPNKGLLFMGHVGVGKTYLMKAFATNPSLGFIIKRCKTIALEYREKDRRERTITQYSTFRKNIGKNYMADSNVFTWCFDDLGEELNVNDFGNEENVMQEILESCYNNGLIVHATSNMTPELLLERYGKRVSDRVRQTFNIIEFGDDAKSKRGNK
jgi:predicted ATPase